MSENQEFARPRRMSGLKNGSGKTFQNEQREKDRSSHFTMRRSARGNRHATARVGIMGGTFDPIHNGHLVAASEVAWVYDLDEVIFVPVGRPAFKDEQRVAAAEDRYLMTVIATASNPMFTVSIRALRPDAELFFITGADVVAQLPRWKNYEKMLKAAHFVGVSRPGYVLRPQIDGIDEQCADVLEIPALAISSTDVRNRVRQGKPVWYLVPDGVVQYINKHGLYE